MHAEMENHVTVGDGTGKSRSSIEAEYDFGYGTGRAHLTINTHENVAMALQYSFVGDYVVGLYIEESRGDLIWNSDDSSIQIDSDFFHKAEAKPADGPYRPRCVHARINPSEIVFQHANGYNVTDLNADWSLAPTRLHFNGLIKESDNFGNYTLTASLTEIQFMRNHNNAKYPFVFNYKVQGYKSIWFSILILILILQILKNQY